MDVERLLRSWLVPIWMAVAYLTPAAEAATTAPTFSRTNFPLLGNVVVAADLNAEGIDYGIV